LCGSGVGGFSGFAVIFGVRLGGFCGVMGGVMKMTLGYLSMMGGGFVIVGFMVGGCGAMMTSGVFETFCGLLVMLCCLFRHGSLLECDELTGADDTRDGTPARVNAT
jgi:hypothetical protein